MLNNKLTKTVDHYTFSVIDKLGTGFSSQVYKGIDEITKQTVAIKIIDLHQVDTQISQTLLQNEIDILPKLEHPNIIKTYKVYQSQNNVYIVSEFCSQGDLADLIYHQKLINEQLAYKVLSQISLALKYLYDNRILHRDIKPANILISNSGFKLADFGFASSLNVEQPILKNFNVGTPLYMAPETIQHNINSEKTEIWALGVVAYEMLHGYPPFKAGTTEQMSGQIRINPQVNRKFQILLHNMIHPDPYKRFGINDLVSYFNVQPQQQIIQSDRRQNSVLRGQTQYSLTTRGSTQMKRSSTPRVMRVVKGCGFSGQKPYVKEKENYKDMQCYIPNRKNSQQREILNNCSNQSTSPSQRKSFTEKTQPINVKVIKHSSSKPNIPVKPKIPIPLHTPSGQKRKYEFRNQYSSQNQQIIEKEEQSSRLQNEQRQEDQDQKMELKPFQQIQITPVVFQNQQNKQNGNYNQVLKNIEQQIQQMNDNYIKRQQNRLERSFSSGKKYKSNKEDNSEKKEIERNEDKQADKKEEKEVKKKEDGLIKFCRFLEQMSCKVNYSTVLGKKVMFLIWKCIAIKLHKQEKSQFKSDKLLRFNQIHKLLRSEIKSGDNRFDCLFNEDIEDDCSGFYAIFIHYLKRVIESEDKRELQVLKELIQKHLNEFDENEKWDEWIEEIIVD